MVTSHQQQDNIPRALLARKSLDYGTCNIVAPYTFVFHAGVWYDEMVAPLSTVDSIETSTLDEIKGNQMLSFCSSLMRR